MSTSNDAYSFYPSQPTQPEYRWNGYVADLAARGSVNRYIHGAAMARAPYDAGMPEPSGNFPWRGFNQLGPERVLLAAATRSPDFAAELSAYETRLGQHTLSPDTSEALRKLGGGAQPPAGRVPSHSDVADAARRLRADHITAVAQQATQELSTVKKSPSSSTHERAWEASQHLRLPWDNRSWGTLFDKAARKAQRKEGTRFLVTQMGQELRGALALIEPPDGGEVGRRQIAEFDSYAEKVLGKWKNGGRAAVDFYRSHANNPPPRLPPAAGAERAVAPSPRTGRAAGVTAAITALGPGLTPTGGSGPDPRGQANPRTVVTSRQFGPRTEISTALSRG